MNIQKTMKTKKINSFQLFSQEQRKLSAKMAAITSTLLHSIRCEADSSSSSTTNAAPKQKRLLSVTKPSWIVRTEVHICVCSHSLISFTWFIFMLVCLVSKLYDQDLWIKTTPWSFFWVLLIRTTPWSFSCSSSRLNFENQWIVLLSPRA